MSSLVLTCLVLILSSFAFTVTQTFKLTPSSARKERLTLTLTLTLSLSPNPDLMSGPSLTPTTNSHLGKPTEMSLNVRNVILGFVPFCCCLVFHLSSLAYCSCRLYLSFCLLSLVSYLIWSCVVLLLPCLLLSSPCLRLFCLALPSILILFCFVFLQT